VLKNNLYVRFVTLIYSATNIYIFAGKLLQVAIGRLIQVPNIAPLNQLIRIYIPIACTLVFIKSMDVSMDREVM